MQIFLLAISYLSVVVWLIPPIRQYRTRYFLYFLVLALSDPINISSFYIFHTGIWTGNVLTSCFSLIALLKRQRIKKNLTPIAAYIFIVFYLMYNTNMNGMRILTGINMFLILLMFVNDFVVSLKYHASINLFYIAVLLYNIANFIKVIFSFSHVKTGFIYFYITTFFQIFIAVYFSFFNVKNSRRLSLFSSETT